MDKVEIIGKGSCPGYCHEQLPCRILTFESVFYQFRM